ncbi:hypothetical protein [Thalassotalea sp. PLHSN55]|uniref:hypothetical protein n=1 Tax=Thalassotalea sp. PLHSN55 TaxID=3435888 RepID=UPI003F853681
MMSGIDGGNCILSSMAKTRVESNMIDGAEVVGTKGSYIVTFKGNAAEWEDKSIVLSSSRQPYEPRIFKSLDGAIAELTRIGLNEASVKIIENDK